MNPIRSDIEKFLTDHGISATAFGERAMNDRSLVHKLRKGRRIWPETEEKVRRFMATHPQRPDA